MNFPLKDSLEKLLTSMRLLAAIVVVLLVASLLMFYRGVGGANLRKVIDTSPPAGRVTPDMVRAAASAGPGQTPTEPGAEQQSPPQPESQAKSLVATKTASVATTGALAGTESNATKPPAQNGAAKPAGSFAANVRPLLDEQGQPVSPSTIAVLGGDIYFLSPDCLWVAADGASALAVRQPLTLKKLLPGKKIAFQEFVNMVAFPAHRSIIVLDKSGDLFEYFPEKEQWALYRSNLPFLSGQPDPEFIDLCVCGNQVAVLDPERNNIWKTAGHKVAMTGSFKNILPWRVKKGDAYMGDAVSIADDDGMYVLRRTGWISKYTDGQGEGFSTQVPFHFVRLPKMRPTRLLTAHGTPLYVVERENCRVVALNKSTGKPSQFLFSKNADLRGLVPLKNGFWVINGSTLCYRDLARPDSLKVHYQTRSLDSRLDALIIPIAGITLPHHPGVYPGARRLYRFGIHAGLDFFNPGGKPPKVVMGTPIRAADTGKVIRADGNFKPMTEAQFSHIMNECYRQHRTSDHNEDLFRGCQVWIDHGNGLVTRYAHLSKINPKVKKGDFVNSGALIGFVGVTGTGQELPGRAKYPHLHFEIRLDGKYLGWGLTQPETVGIYENIFGRS